MPGGITKTCPHHSTPNLARATAASATRWQSRPHRRHQLPVQGARGERHRRRRLVGHRSGPRRSGDRRPNRPKRFQSRDRAFRRYHLITWKNPAELPVKFRPGPPTLRERRPNVGGCRWHGHGVRPYPSRPFVGERRGDGPVRAVRRVAARRTGRGSVRAIRRADRSDRAPGPGKWAERRRRRRFPEPRGTRPLSRRASCRAGLWRHASQK